MNTLFLTQNLKLYNGKKNASSTNGAGITGCQYVQELIDPYLSLWTKFKSKWIKDLNINLTTLNLIEEKVGSSLQCMGTEEPFPNITPVAQN